MKNLLSLLLAVLLYAAALAQPASDEQAMRAFTRAYMAAYNRQDVDALRAMYTTDALCILEGRDTIRGAEEMANRFASRFTRVDGTLLMRHVALHWPGAEPALAVGIYEGYGATYVYDIPYHGVTAYANTMVQENGVWKIARSVLTSPVKVMAYQKVDDFGAWKAAFVQAQPRRLAAGELSSEIGTLCNDPQTAYVLSEWASLEHFQTFFASPDREKARPEAGVAGDPVVLILDRR